MKIDGIHSDLQNILRLTGYHKIDGIYYED